MEINFVFKYNSINVSYIDKTIYIKILPNATAVFLREIIKYYARK